MYVNVYLYIRFIQVLHEDYPFDCKIWYQDLFLHLPNCWPWLVFVELIRFHYGRKFADWEQRAIFADLSQLPLLFSVADPDSLCPTQFRLADLIWKGICASHSDWWAIFADPDQIQLLTLCCSLHHAVLSPAGIFWFSDGRAKRASVSACASFVRPWHYTLFPKAKSFSANFEVACSQK